MSVARELRRALRSFRRHPGFTSLAVATIATGVAATTAIFSVADGVLLRPLPFDDPDELVTLDVRDVTGHYISLSIPNYSDWRERSRAFETFGASTGWTMTLSGTGGSEVVRGRLVLGEFFETLRTPAARGRLIPAGETGPGAPPAAVISHGLWTRRFGGDPGVVGRSLTLDGRPYTLVGILPPGVGYPSPETEVYTPMGVLADRLPWDDRSSSFGARAVARLAPGFTVDRARRDMERVVREVREAEGEEVAAAEVRSLEDFFVGDVRSGIWLVFAAVGLVLVVACANVAGLLLVRAERRHRELAVRSALGAGRARVARTLLVESVVLAVAGGAAGLVLAYPTVAGLAALLPETIPAGLAARVGIDARVVLFAAGASLAAAVATGLLPALRGSRVSLAATLRTGGGPGGRGAGRSRLRAGLVAGEVALATVLLVGAALTVETARSLARVETGFRADAVLTARFPLPRTDYPEKASWHAFYDRLLDRSRTIPGVSSAALTLLVPLENRNYEVGVRPEAGEAPVDERDSGLYNVVSPGYFETLGIRLVRGRTFDEGDRDDGEPVVIVDESLAARYWPGEDPVGKRITFETAPGSTHEDPVPLYRRVVGVVESVRHYTLEEPSRIQLYVPFDQTLRSWGMDLNLALRADGDPRDAVPAIRAVVVGLDADVPLHQVRTLEARVDEHLSEPRALAVLLAAFGLVAVLLAAVGIFGIVSYAVVQRTREIGIRRALGARGAAVVRRFAGEGLAVTGAGLAGGLAGAALASRFLEGFLFGVEPVDPALYAGIALLVAVLTLGAVAIPAGRSARVDPAEVLRHDG